MFGFQMKSPWDLQWSQLQYDIFHHSCSGVDWNILWFDSWWDVLCRAGIRHQLVWHYTIYIARWLKAWLREKHICMPKTCPTWCPCAALALEQFGFHLSRYALEQCDLMAGFRMRGEVPAIFATSFCYIMVNDSCFTNLKWLCHVWGSHFQTFNSCTWHANLYNNPSRIIEYTFPSQQKMEIMEISS